MADKHIKTAATFGKWEVSKNGTMVHDNCYEIHYSDLNEDDWLLHISEKGWNNWNDFIPAYLHALRNAGIDKVTIKTNY